MLAFITKSKTGRALFLLVFFESYHPTETGVGVGGDLPLLFLTILFIEKGTGCLLFYV